jgi:Flp pilus assembly protein TadG
VRRELTVHGRRLGLFRLHKDEEGVTAIIVALCLVALIGMMVLVVDVGGLLWKRREMVSGADAAALAAAETCSVGTDVDPSDPEAIADAVAIDNVQALTISNGGIVQTSGCSTSARAPRGYVTVQYSESQQLFFAGIFGKSSTPVTTQATAAWGPLSRGNAVPIILESSQFQGTCDVPNVQVGTVCAFWYNNASSGSGTNGIGVGGFGFLNLDTWGIDRYSSGCNGAGGANNIGNYIINNYNGNANIALEDPGPTYVCLDHGHQASNWMTNLCERWNGVMQNGNGCSYLPVPPNTTYPNWPGRKILQPVNDCARQVDNKGSYVPCGSNFQNVDKFAVIGFTTLELGDAANPTVPAVLRGDDARAVGSTGATGSCPNNTTLGPAGTGAYGMGGWDINQLAVSACGAPGAPQTISNLTVKNGGNTFVQCTPSTLAPNCDYVWDDSTRTLSWYNLATRTGADTYKLSFTWQLADTAGYCGTRAKDPNALCIIATWEGYSSQPGQVGGGEDFGTQGTVLCDFKYGSCPPGVTP